MNKLSLILSVLFSLHCSAQSDSDFEQKMHDIYKSSYSQEISDQQWESYLEGIGSRTYQVQEGDTLWDLSIVFFGDGFYWSKLWSYNENLTNPHQLRVAQKVHFFAGSFEQAPGFSVDEKLNVARDDGFVEVKEKVEIKQARVERSQLYPGAPSIPAPRRGTKPVLKNLPSSFVDSESFDSSKYDSNGMSFDVRPPVRVNPLFVAHYFLYGQDYKNYPKVGRLVEEESKSELVGVNQYVYIQSEEDLKTGDVLTAMGRGYHFDRNGYEGDVIQYQGTIKIETKVKENIVRGRVIQSLSGLRGNPWVTREPIPTIQDDYEGRLQSNVLRIIGGGHDNSSRLFGQNDVVFLNGGADDGLKVGDILGVYKRRDIRYSNVKVEKSPVPIAHLKVFRVEPEFASAFVLQSEEVIIPGDQTGDPQFVKNNPLSSNQQEQKDSVERTPAAAVEKKEIKPDATEG